MYIVLSPAKKLDFETKISVRPSKSTLFPEETDRLAQILAKKSKAQLAQLMKLSPNLSELNYDRYQNLAKNSDSIETRPAVRALNGDTYIGLAAVQWSNENLTYAQKHLGILSGLYGLLRPKDPMSPYRLEMGTALKNSEGKDLYQFWGDKITKALNKLIKASKSEVLVHLASNEYFKSINQKLLTVPVFTPQFKILKDGKLKSPGMMAKRARGMMANYIIQNELTEVKQLKKFKVDGYRYTEMDGDELCYLFVQEK